MHGLPDMNTWRIAGKVAAHVHGDDLQWSCHTTWSRPHADPACQIVPPWTSPHHFLATSKAPPPQLWWSWTQSSAATACSRKLRAHVPHSIGNSAYRVRAFGRNPSERLRVTHTEHSFKSVNPWGKRNGSPEHGHSTYSTFENHRLGLSRSTVSSYGHFWEDVKAPEMAKRRFTRMVNYRAGLATLEADGQMFTVIGKRAKGR
ncbi:uncharacterized protein LOC119951277 [Scyliorhinus canicula]|uniref:uncharacterized protein LOC119951277 n=1 Tax=Scyliorhinus canicula TaxID=7830 RepID=UPI0018F3A3A7|nr:uncharacterized protein LOC119951277 [Scyliorhinus canicula]